VLFHFGYLPASCGELGVMMFFVLSGFLITRILLMEYLKSGTISLREFYRRRTLRIFPTFYVCWLIETLLIALHREHIRWWEPCASFLYLTDYARAIAGPQTIRHMAIAWSLAIEEQFSALARGASADADIAPECKPRRGWFHCLRVDLQGCSLRRISRFLRLYLQRV
jgi:peptidoglycan/LPS O-acetylase OafA/YrhL